MKKVLLLFIYTFIITAHSIAQISKRAPLPDLKFSNKTQSATFEHIKSLYDKGEPIRIENEFLDHYWEGFQQERMGAVFIQYLVWSNESEESSFSCKDVAIVGKALLDHIAKEKGMEISSSFPANYNQYKKLVYSFLEPVKEKMVGGAQIEMNQFCYTDSDFSKYLSMLKAQLIISRLFPSKLKSALYAENSSWMNVRSMLGNLFYDVKCAENGGIGYSMLPLFVGALMDRADAVRDSSLVAFSASSVEDIKAALSNLQDKDYSQDMDSTLKEFQNEGVDLTLFHSIWNEFVAKREEVAKLLPENIKSLYKQDTQRYISLIAFMTIDIE